MLQACKTLFVAAAAAAFGWAVVQCVLRTLRPAPAVSQAAGAWPCRRTTLRVMAFCLVAGAAWQGGFWLYALAQSPGTTPLQAIAGQLYGNTDARHYLDLAQYGYGSGETFPEQYLMIVFFPLFPLLLRLCNPLGALPWELVALAVQLPLFCLAGAGLYALTHRHFGVQTARWTLVFLLASPGSLFFFAPMTESLFLALCVGYILCLEQGRWWLCGALGVLAGLTRAPGGMLLGLAAVYLVQQGLAQKRRPPAAALAAVAGPLLGLACYFGLNVAVYGQWNQYSVYQNDHWNNRLGLFTDVIRYHLDYFAGWWGESPNLSLFLCLPAVLCIVVGFGLLAAAAKTLPPHYLAYGLAYLTVTMGVSWLISAPRYAVALFCLPMALAALLRRRPLLRGVVLVALLACNLVYSAQYLTHGPIY